MYLAVIKVSADTGGPPVSAASLRGTRPVETTSDALSKVRWDPVEVETQAAG